MARIVSYNCNSIRNNSETVKFLLANFDIVVLQEIMLEKRDIGILNDFNPNFKHIVSVKDREMEGVCEGRPSGGVAIFWRTCLSPFISPVFVDDSIIGVTLETENFKVLLLNIYLPCDKQSIESVDKYKQALTTLELVIREQSANQIVLIGDFNADPSKGRFWKLLQEFNQSLSLVVMDKHFPNGTFTYLCPSKSSTSWLDHIVCTEKVANCIRNVSVDYRRALFDHFPVHFVLDVLIDTLANTDNIDTHYEFVNWRKMQECDKQRIRDRIDRDIEACKLLEHDVLYCYDMKCVHQNHNRELSELLSIGKTILLQSTEEFQFVNERRFKIIPGWNDHVKELYAVARENFIIWKENGKPLNGKLEENMKYTRSKFRAALNSCKSNENHIRNGKLLNNLISKDYRSFWGEVFKTNNHNIACPTAIDGKSNFNDICNTFSDKYKEIFNKKGETYPSSIHQLKWDDKEKLQFLIKFTKEDVKRAIKLLKDGISFDKIHSNHLKLESDLFIEFFAKLITSFVIHSFIPMDLLRGLITPLVKDKFGDLSLSSNYRPVMSSSVLLKLFEYCLLSKIDPYIELNDRQHGFRKKTFNINCLLLLEGDSHVLYEC